MDELFQKLIAFSQDELEAHYIYQTSLSNWICTIHLPFYVDLTLHNFPFSFGNPSKLSTLNPSLPTA
jgi:hypothetical protein